MNDVPDLPPPQDCDDLPESVELLKAELETCSRDELIALVLESFDAEDQLIALCDGHRDFFRDFFEKIKALDKEREEVFEMAIDRAVEKGVAAGIEFQKTEHGKRAAIARHAENRRIAESIMEWYKEHHVSFRSMDKAAEAVMKIEPIGFRTARKHIGEAAKKYALHGKRKSNP